MRSLWKAIRVLSTLCLMAVIAGLAYSQSMWTWEFEDWALPDQGSRSGWIDTDAVNLRAGPSTETAILDVLTEGGQVSVSGDAVAGFVPVEVDGTSAWIFADYVAMDQPPSLDLGIAANVAHAAEPEQEPTGSDNSRPRGDEPNEPTGERWIEVDRSTAMVTLHIGDTAIASFKGKIGRDPSDDGFYSTAVGTYHVFSKNPGLTSTPFVEGVYMTEFVGFDPERHNGFHSPIRDEFGELLPSQNATTLGCVRLDEEAARELYAFAYIGMRVEVHN